VTLLAVGLRSAQTGAVNVPALLWLFRLVWLALPFTLLEHLVDATAGDRSAPRLAAQVLFWVLWGVTFTASLVPLPSTLTLTRILAPTAPAAWIAAAIVVSPSAAGWAGLACGTFAAVVVMAASVGDWFVDGPSYGDERRMALRPPAALLVGPLQVAWVLTVVPVPAGVMLLAAGVWLLGVPLAVLGCATAWWGFFALWRLSRRWAVFVPAGMTLVDDMALGEPILLRADAITRLGPAHEGTDALDLTVRAPGLVLEADLCEPVHLVPAVTGRDAVAEPTEATAILFVPSRPGALLAHADQRDLAVDRG